MTITGQVNRKTFSHEDTYEGIFSELTEPVDYGQAGKLSPSSWELRIVHTTYIVGEDTRARVSYTVKLFAQSPHGAHNTYTAAFSHPHLMVVSPYDYGYGSASKLQEAPVEILEFLSEITDTNVAATARELL